MKQRVMGYAAVTVALMLLVAVSASAQQGVWVSSDSAKVDISHDHHGMNFGEGATTISMDDLADGETRVVGMGEGQVTLSRRGDEVTITRAASEGREVRDMTCTVGRDSCKVITFDDDPKRVMVLLTKSQSCTSDDEDCGDVNVDVMAMIGAEGKHGNHFVRELHTDGNVTADGVHMIQINKSIECDDEGNCKDFAAILEDGTGAMGNVIIEALEGIEGLEGLDIKGLHGANVFIAKPDHVTLRCSEGDTTMNVETEEADDVFLCPKHSTPLEKVKGHPRMLRHKVKAHRDSD